MSILEPLSLADLDASIGRLAVIRSGTIAVTDSYTVAAGDDLRLKGNIGFKLESKGGSTVDLTIDGTVSMHDDQHKMLIAVASTDAPSGTLNFTLGAGASLSVDSSAAGASNVVGVFLQAGTDHFTSDGDIQVASAAATSYGVYINGGDVSFANTGAVHIDTTGNGGLGMLVQGDHLAFTNSGDIDVQAGGIGQGLGAVAFVDGTFRNDGDLTATATNLAGGLSAQGEFSTVNNTGDVTATCLDASASTDSSYGALGFAVGDASYASVGAGVIDNSGHIVADGGSHSAEGVLAGGVASFHNSGVIEAISTGGGLATSFASTGVALAAAGIVVNDGVISGQYAIIGYDLVITGGGFIAFDDNVVNNGAMIGVVSLGDGADRFDSHAGTLDGAVWGGGGSDTLIGSKGADMINGGDETAFGGTDAADLILGLGGADTMSGGDGNDVFRYARLGDSTAGAADLITDLSNGDVIDLHRIDADTGNGGDQAFHLVGAFSGAAGELTVSYDSGSGLTTIAGDVTGDGVADLVITASGDHHDFTNFVL